VKIVRASLSDHLAWMLGGTSYVAQIPGGAWMVLCIWLTGAVFRLLSEWQLRRTLTEVLDHSPGGTIVVVHRRTGGPSVWMQVGHWTQPRAAAPLSNGRV
jgi:hypothetical protein